MLKKHIKDIGTLEKEDFTNKQSEDIGLTAGAFYVKVYSY